MFKFLQILRYAKRSPKWSTVRKKHIEANPCCIACGKSKKLEVHHIKPVHLYPELELDPSNIVTLCADPCHITFGHFMDFKSWNKDVVADSAAYLNKVLNKP
jgi:5-methylcytosine-specific restriction protein A